MLKKISILNTKITIAQPLTMSRQAVLWLTGRKQRQIVTPNPEFLLTALTDDVFHHVLNHADLAVPDGIGLKFAAWLQHKNLGRLAGSDLVQTLLTVAEKKHLPMAIINWQAGLSDKKTITATLKKRWPKLKVLIQDISRDKLNYDITALQAFAPTTLFCSLGAPYQDKLIHHLLPKLPSVKVGMGVGGSFDYLTGKTKRAPQWLRALGLEWLWRLLIQPHHKLQRFKRIYRAVVCFSWLAFKEHYINGWFYRPNIVGWLYNKQGEVLILNSNKAQEDYWGLPQGGVDNKESRQTALYREMREEIGTNNFKIINEYINIFQYRWPKNYGIMNYKGQKQSLYILEFIGQKSEIKLSHEHKGQKWVPISRLLDEADQIHRKAYQLFLDKYHEAINNQNKSIDKKNK